MNKCARTLGLEAAAAAGSSSSSANLSPCKSSTHEGLSLGFCEEFCQGGSAVVGMLLVLAELGQVVASGFRTRL
jgi:hypothetical protein